MVNAVISVLNDLQAVKKVNLMFLFSVLFLVHNVLRKISSSTLFNKLVQGKFLNYIGIILQLEEKYVSGSPYI